MVGSENVLTRACVINQSISAKRIDTLNWGSHVEGAVQLVKARGKRQTRTKRGLQLFIAVRTLMVSRQAGRQAGGWAPEEKHLANAFSLASSSLSLSLSLRGIKPG